MPVWDRRPVAVTPVARQLGWLLRVNRRHGPDLALRSGREFARAFRPYRPITPSQLTRWESGELGVTHATVQRYEQVLDLLPGSLTTVSDALVRYAGTTPARGPSSRPVSDGDRARLHELLARGTAADRLTGSEWNELTRLVAGRPDLELHPPQIWRSLVESLLHELVVSADRAWQMRQESMSRLLEHAAAAPYAVAACIAMVEDDSTPAVLEPLSLLDVSPHPDANRFVLRQLTSPRDDRTMLGALLASVGKVRRRHFQDDDQARLIQVITATAQDDRIDAAMFQHALDVGEALRGRAAVDAKLGAALRSPRAVHELTRFSGATAQHPASTRIAARARAELSAEPDHILSALIGEALYGANIDRRLLATTQISASPYRTPVARALLDEVMQDLTRRTRLVPMATALWTLTQMQTDHHRPIIHAIVSGPEYDASTQHAAAAATPHCPGQFTRRQWRAMLDAQMKAWQSRPSPLREEILRCLTYGIGTAADRTLLTEIRESATMPATARTTASWLLSTDQPPS